jgi:kynureninase
VHEHAHHEPPSDDEHVLPTDEGTVQDSLRSSRLSLRPSECTFISCPERTADSGGQYAFISQVKRHGLDVDSTLIEMSAREGEYNLREEDILDTIAKRGSEIALVMFSGIQYWSGQLFPMERITKKGKEMV